MKLLISLIAALLLMLAGCSGNANPSPAASPTVAPTPNVSNGDDGTVNDPPAANDEPVEAEDRPKTFKETFSYESGVKIDVVKIATKRLGKDAYTENDAKAGTPYVVLTIKVTNGSKKSIEVGNYEEVLTYGKDGVKAVAVQDEGIEAIDGKVLPGRSRTGTYGWIVAKKDRKEAQLEFEWDADNDDCCEDPALFAGPLSA